jgi:hypothetical protein
MGFKFAVEYLGQWATKRRCNEIRVVFQFLSFLFLLLPAFIFHAISRPPFRKGRSRHGSLFCQDSMDTRAYGRGTSVHLMAFTVHGWVMDIGQNSGIAFAFMNVLHNTY